jgi:tRNA modification GTPase
LRLYSESKKDSIVALSTPYGKGAIAVVRMSGSQSFEILKKHIKLHIDLSDIQERRMYYGNFFDTDGGLIDEVMFVYFRSPKSYTGEDMVEIYCHGGILVSSKIIDSLIRSGARLAENGEFTRRAFLNGKIDLIKAEAILQIIEAKSEKSLKLALDNLKGRLSHEISAIRSQLLDVLSKIEVSIDYGDDVDIPSQEILQGLEKIHTYLCEKLKHADKGLHISTGVTIVIVGKPNVGKSTLLNKLLVEDRAIVTDVPGTTRDVIKGEIKIQGIHFVISDTAGIRETQDMVEKIGIEKALKEAQRSDIVLFLLDATTGYTEADEYIHNLIKNGNILYVWNKVDIGKNIKSFGKDVFISAQSGEGIKELEKRIIELAKPLIEDSELSHITSRRQLEYMKQVRYYVDKSINSLKSGLPMDLASIDIRTALSKLDELTGYNFNEDLLNNIFSNFCVGK